MENGNGEDSINKLEKRLYGSRPISGEKGRTDLRPLSYDVKTAFEGGDIADMKRKSQHPETPILRKLLIASGIFFISSLVISAYFFLGGSNVVSTSNVDISLSGPVSVKGGESFGLQVLISNKNNIPLQFAELVVDYPEGAVPPKSDSTVPNRYIKDLGTIPNNAVINETIPSILFGEENSEQEVKVSIEYRTEGSNATFVKEKSYKTFISSSPLSLALDLPTDVSSDKDVNLNVAVNSNSSDVLKDVVLQVDYPSGFIFKSATPSPSYGQGFWELGDLLAKGQRSIKITGSMQGQDGDVKSFRASAGTRNSKDDNNVTLVYGSSLKSLVVKKPFIGLGIALNGDSASSDYVADSNGVLRGDITWTNNLPVKVLNGQLTVKVNGDVIDKSTVSAGQGFYSSADNSITWNRTNGDFPQSIEPSQTGTESFTLNFLPLISGRRTIFQNPVVNVEVTFSGNQFAQGGGSGSVVENTVKRQIKLQSDLQLTARALYYNGPFKNTGSLPPEVDKPTTYTIVWSVVNSSNDVNGAVVKASLPSYIKWLGNISPSSEDISYNPLGGQVTWNVGSIPAGSGITSQAREVAFQVSFQPSISQLGQYPVLISDTTITGGDAFTNTDTSSVRKSLDIELTTDSVVTSDQNGPIKQ